MESTGCTFFLGSPGGADSSLRMLSRRPRTRSVGVRCFVLKKFMGHCVGMIGGQCARRRGVLRWGGRESGCGGEEHEQSDYSWVLDFECRHQPDLIHIQFTPSSSFSSLFPPFSIYGCSVPSSLLGRPLDQSDRPKLGLMIICSGDPQQH